MDSFVQVAILVFKGLSAKYVLVIPNEHVYIDNEKDQSREYD
jgi:hypothetical protein